MLAKKQECCGIIGQALRLLSGLQEYPFFRSGAFGVRTKTLFKPVYYIRPEVMRGFKLFAKSDLKFTDTGVPTLCGVEIYVTDRDSAPPKRFARISRLSRPRRPPAVS